MSLKITKQRYVLNNAWLNYFKNNKNTFWEGELYCFNMIT